MTDFCDFVPDDPSCAKPDPVENTPDNGGEGMMDDGDMMMKNEGKMMDMEMHPMLGNLTYLHVAIFGLIDASHKMYFYYDENEYDAGEVLGTNLWKMTA